jgi:hypothetical protein
MQGQSIVYGNSEHLLKHRRFMLVNGNSARNSGVTKAASMTGRSASPTQVWSTSHRERSRVCCVGWAVPRARRLIG